MPRRLLLPVPADGRPVVLVGMTGAGKTTVGRLLAHRLGWDHVDTDEIVAAEAGMSVAELWADQGEAAFRAAERRAIAQALQRGGGHVVSVGGGAVSDPHVRGMLGRAATVVWLRATDDTLVRRLQGADGDARPVLQGDPAGQVPVLARARRPWFEAVADLVVDVDAQRPDDVAEAVVAGLASVGPSGGAASESPGTGSPGTGSDDAAGAPR